MPAQTARREDLACTHGSCLSEAMSKAFALSVFSLTFLATSLLAQPSGTKDSLPPAPEGKSWKLVWHDEFDGAKLDETKWNRLGDSKRRDGYWVKDDAYLSDRGTLLLRTRKDGDRFTCGAVNTQGKFEHAFGYYVARCKMPKQPGHWPAFWMMCRGVGTVGEGGRDGTEIDIVEIPWRDGKVTMNLHWDGYEKEHKSAGTSMTLPELIDGFHDYGLLWSAEEYVFYIDGKEVWRSKAGGVSQVTEYLKLTEEIGTWGGDIKKAELPDYFEVDYVRVYDLRP
jgi:beta-glucanase (GH16 family)